MPRDNDNERDQKLVPSTAELDFEQRMKADRGEKDDSDPALVGRDFSGGRDEDEVKNFVGVSPEYRNFSNEVDRPLPAEEGTAVAYFEEKHVEASDAIITGAEDRLAASYVVPGTEVGRDELGERIGAGDPVATDSTDSTPTPAPTPAPSPAPVRPARGTNKKD